MERVLEDCVSARHLTKGFRKVEGASEQIFSSILSDLRDGLWDFCLVCSSHLCPRKGHGMPTNNYAFLIIFNLDVRRQIPDDYQIVPWALPWE